MLRLRRLTVHRYRDVVPGTRLEFHDGINVVLGKNGSGKTTLLELVSAILQFNFRPLASEVFDIEFEMEHAAPPVSCKLHARVTGRMDDALVANLRLPNAAAENRQEAHITLSVPGQETHTIVVKDDWVQIEHQGGVLYMQAGQRFVDPDTLTGWRAMHGQIMPSSIRAMLDALLANVFRTRRFDEALLTFDELTGLDHEYRVSARLRLPGFSGFPLGILDFASWALVDAAMRKLANDQNASTLTLEHEELPFLARTVELCGYESARMELRLLEQKPDVGGVEQSSFGKARFLFTRKNHRTIFEHDYLSYGQKRLLALLFYLEVNQDLVVADELVNGMHHEWLEDIMGKLTRRQAFLSSQNPLLLDYLEFDSAEQVKRSFVLCSVDDDDRMTWRNMTDDEACAFHDAYEAGIQHVSEILRTKGLW